MTKVNNLMINFQSGSNNTYYANWEFDDTVRNTTTTTSTSSSGVGVGKWVKIKSGATYYNGVAIPSYVMSDTWKVIELRGNRAVINENKSGTHRIMSPINVKYLVGETTSSSSSSTTVIYNTLDHYEVEWYYHTGDGIWFSNGSSSNTNNTHSTYSPPENARLIKITVKPVSKTHKVNDKDTSYWTGTSVSTTYNISDSPPEKPNIPTVTIDKYTLTATIENISDPRSDQIQFQVLNGTSILTTGTSSVITCRATFTCNVSAGGDYRVRCRSINLVGGTSRYSDWSDYSNSMSAIPAAVSGISVCKAMSETSIYLEWSKVNTATSYDIQHTTNKRYFDNSDSVTTINNIEYPHYEITGLDSGNEYFFRVRAVNENGGSTWSDIKSTVIGKKPTAPTTWSSTTTCITGESLTLYWAHNCEDGSDQTFAELELTIDGDTQIYTIRNTKNEDGETVITHSYSINTSSYSEGTIILWRVRTAGATKVYGDWSVQRAVNIYAPPTLELNMITSEGIAIDTVESFPFYVTALAGPNTQAPIGFHLSIISKETYETIDYVGNPIIINQGEILYSKYFDVTGKLMVEFSASNVDLQNGINYSIECVVSMNSGLTQESSLDFVVSWADEICDLDAEITIDRELFTAYIRPYCINPTEELLNNLMLSVYRREFDGTFTELSKNIDAVNNTAIVDPHPSLDYARYRIVATTKDTGSITYYDVPGQPFGIVSVIVQWDDEWSNFDSEGEDALYTPPWTGSLLELPYNIDVSDSHDIDVEFVEYIGRSHPVSYYGTQLGETSTWNMEIPKSDRNTLYTIRRLAIWPGDVYVREPSGSGYWANISVSYNQTHCNLTIPITFTITRVEGGI